MPDEMKQIASRLKEIREISDFSVEETAARLGISV